MKREAVRFPDYRVKARNTSTGSENKIHDDSVARRYGFGGGLVPGVSVYAYATRPLVEALGRDWLERGTASVKFVKPIFDGDDVRVCGNIECRPEGATVTLTVNAANGDCAFATATLADGAGTNIVGQTGVTATAATLTSIAVTPGSALRPVGATQQFVAVGTFSDGSTLPITEQVTWASSEASVATISNQLGTQGLATVIAGLLPITTTISATRGPGTATASLSRGLL